VTVTLSFDRPKPGSGRLGARWRRLRDLARSVPAAIVTPHKASLARLADMPLTVIGAGFIDFAGFHLAHGWGWLITGGTLLVVERMIADED
jgi:hypothetical protein